MVARNLGWIVVLNGAPRSGKSSIATAMQEQSEGIWVNLGVDAYQCISPPAIRPSIGLRPGGERPDIEAHLPVLFAALYESIAAHSRLGLNVVVDIGHHDAYSKRLHLLADSVGRLHGLPVLMVGVRCPLSAILDRRSVPQPGRPGVYARGDAAGHVPAPILAWQNDVHIPGIYDLDVDTSELSPAAIATSIETMLRDGVPRPTAAERIVQAHAAAGVSGIDQGKSARDDLDDGIRRIR
jgi:chloramphenicol 3-O phosphotransferase